jgi:hypothetical protein
MEGKRTVFFYDPVKYAAAPYLSMAKPNNWPAFFSTSNDVSSLKYEMIRYQLTNTANIQLDILYDGCWLNENSVQQIHNGKLPDPVYARAMPAPKPVLAPGAFPCKLASCWLLLHLVLAGFPCLNTGDQDKKTK